MKSTNQIWEVTHSFLRRRLAGNQWWRRQMLAVLSGYRLAAMKTNGAYRKINQSGLCFVILLGSLNNNGDANESVKKIIDRFIEKESNNFARAAHFFGTSISLPSKHDHNVRFPRLSQSTSRSLARFCGRKDKKSATHASRS